MGRVRPTTSSSADPPPGTTIEEPASTTTDVDLEALAEAQAVSEVLELPSGRRVEITSFPEQIRVSSPTGRVELSIRLTEEGPQLSFESADIELRATQKLSLECRDLAISAARTAEISAEDVVVTARGHARVTGGTAAVEATEGDVLLTANDNVSAVGERILLNCDGSDEVPNWLATALDAKLAPAAPERLPRRDVTGNSELFDASNPAKEPKPWPTA